MVLKRRYLLIAVALTALDLFAVLRYGAVVWRAYANVLPARQLLVLFVAVCITSLANLWSRVFSVVKEAPRPRRIRLSEISPSTAAKAEASDV